MDDFGSGYSSLSMLKDIPFDLIKLDMKFFSGIENEKSEAIVVSLINLVKTLKLEIIAEGVEDIKISNKLKTKGVTLIQGFLYSKPIPESDFIKFITEIND